MERQNYRMEDSLGYHLGKAYRLLEYAMQKYFDEKNLGLTTDDWIILVYLLHKTCDNQQWLANLIAKDKATITRIIDGLESKSMVMRVAGKEDRRQKEIILTETGKKLVVDLTPEIESKSLEFLEDVSNEEYDEFKEVLKKISKNILNKVKK